MLRMSNSILIVGDKGMLAHAIKRSLGARHLAHQGVDLPECDITDADSVAAAFERVRPAVVINCAAFTNVDGCETKPDVADAVNGRGVGNLAAACRERSAVHFSTDYVFDGTLRRPLRPEDPVGPASAYGRSKLLGERLLQENAPPRWLIVRTAWLYGPNGPNFPQAILNAARAGKPLRVVCDQVGCPTFTYDLADATMELLDRGAAGVWHLSNGGQTNWCDFARAVLAEFGVDKPVEPIDSAEWAKIKPGAAVRPAYSVFDVAPYERLVGKKMPEWRDALRRYREAVEI
jgi:dTDP-4-dehydrorhamnose reductase